MKDKKGNSITSVQEAARAFGDHEGISKNSVRNWCEQFGSAHPSLTFKILNNVNYYSGTEIRMLVTELVKSIYRHKKINERKHVLFVPIGGPSEGSFVVARALRGTLGVRKEQIKHIAELADFFENSPIHTIVLLDDFSGSGDRFTDWWKNVETLLLPWVDKSVKLIFGILVLNWQAKEVLKSIPVELIYCTSLDQGYNVLSSKSKIFQDSEKALIEEFCHKTGCGRAYLKGWKNCGLLVAFKHGCPNDSLPILWHKSRTWKRLFKRQAI